MAGVTWEIVTEQVAPHNGKNYVIKKRDVDGRTEYQLWVNKLLVEQTFDTDKLRERIEHTAQLR